ncbi:MAG: UvrD-helicase domain-containing protein, partial [Candidatus Electryoneaceae bacterium]|nr:UvrD-helicase domain-containing protein [Candidatus Electryoneaceae bacterium]
MIKPIDEREREKVRRTLLDASMVVEAGAGTGKTSLLIDRLISLLEKFDITKIAAITFTDKAAGELLERLRRELERRTIQDGKKPNPMLLNALHNIDRAYISTIHSFALSLLRERPVEAELDPDFQHIEPNSERELLEDFLTSELNRTDLNRNEFLTRFRLLGGTFNQLSDLLSKLYEQRDLLDSFPMATPLIEPSVFVPQLRRQLDEMLHIAHAHCRNADDNLIKKLIGLMQGFPDPSNEADGWRWLNLFKTFKPGTLGAKKNWDNPETLDQQRISLAEFVDTVEELSQQTRTHILEELVGWLGRIIGRTEQIKRDKGQIGFQDQLLIVRKLLNQPDSQAYFQSKFDRLLIDEFQDTDPLQVEIAMLLAGKTVGSTDQEDHLEPGKLCVIGDPKQSIYRFRRADPRIYHKASGAIQRIGNKVLITQNFRSAPGIVHFVNAFFGQIWDTYTSDGSQYVAIDPPPGRIDLPSTPTPHSREGDLPSTPQSIPPLLSRGGVRGGNHPPIPAVKIINPSSQFMSQHDEMKAEQIRQVEANAIAKTIKSAIGIW